MKYKPNVFSHVRAIMQKLKEKIMQKLNTILYSGLQYETMIIQIYKLAINAKYFNDYVSMFFCHH